MKFFSGLIYCFAACSLLSCADNTPCVDKMELQPMYGLVKKCKAQKELDEKFLSDCEKDFAGNQAALEFHLNLGWEYYYQNSLDSAIIRFNQAWLLDSTNANVYWGFGNVLGTQLKFDESIPFFEKSLKLNPNNAKVYESAATSLEQLFIERGDTTLLQTAIVFLKKSLVLNPDNARTYGQLTGAYSYFEQKDSALKYLKITQQLDPEAIDPEVERMLLGTNEDEEEPEAVFE